MAGSPQWKVYDAAGTYQAACKEAEAAACLLQLYGAGSSIRFDHSWTVYTMPAENSDVWPDSYDEVTAVCHAEVNRQRRRRGLSPLFLEG